MKFYGAEECISTSEGRARKQLGQQLDEYVCIEKETPSDCEGVAEWYIQMLIDHVSGATKTQCSKVPCDLCYTAFTTYDFNSNGFIDDTEHSALVHMGAGNWFGHSVQAFPYDSVRCFWERSVRCHRKLHTIL